MFYPEDLIKDIVKCLDCSERFEDPRILPCGQTSCFQCIKSKIDTKTNGFQCKYCNQFHQTPENGFQVNLRIKDLTEKTPSDVFRGEKIERLKSKLNKIEQSIQEIADWKVNGPFKIKEHCDLVRIEVDLKAECAIQEINKLRDNLLKQIDEYEQKCLKNLEENSGNLKKLDELLEEKIEFMFKWNEDLKKVDFKDSEAEEGIQKSEEIIEQLELESNLLRAEQFKEGLIKLQESKKCIESDLLGTINFEKKYTNLLNLYLKEVIDLKDYLLECQELKISRFEDGDFIFYLKYEHAEQILIFDYSNKKISGSLTINHEVASLIVNKNKIYLYNNSDLEPDYIVVYDKNLTELKKLILSQKKYFYAFDVDQDEILYIIKTLAFENLLSEYDKDLNLLKETETLNLFGETLFLNSFNKLRLYEDKIFYMSKDSVKVLEKKSKKKLGTFMLEGNEFFIFNGKIVSLDYNSNYIMSYQLDGKMLLKQEFQAKDVVLVDSKYSKEISYLNKNDFKLYIHQ